MLRKAKAKRGLHLTHTSNLPSTSATATLMGKNGALCTAPWGGCVNLVVTSISFAQARHYEDIMDQILTEAKSGLFKTKSDAVRKRDKLIEDKLSEAA